MPRAPDDERDLLSCLSAISKYAFDELKQSPRLTQQLESAVTVLDISGMNNHAQQETHRVDQDMLGCGHITAQFPS
jgi:hypothetical protein